MSQASDMRRRVSLVLILAAVGIIAGYVLRGDGETPAIFGRRPAGYAQLVSIQPLPLMDEVMDGMDGVMCEWAPASSSTPLMASLLQERQSGGAAAQSADPDRRAEAAQRDPVRVIRDSYALYSAVAVDPIRNEVVLTDENLFNIMVYDRLDNTPPSAAMSEPKRMIGGLKTKIEFQCGLYIDPASGDIYAVNNDTIDTLVIFGRQAKGDVPPDRELYTPHGTFGIAVDEANQELFLTIQHDNAVVVYEKMAEGDDAPIRLLQGNHTLLADPHGIAVDTKNDLIFITNHGSIRQIHADIESEAASWMRSSEKENWPLTQDKTVPGSGRIVPSSITVYSRTASGDAAPLRTITGPNAQLNWPSGIAIDSERGEMFVANDAGDSVLVFRTSAGGDEAPIRVLKGPKSLIKNPTSVHLDLVNDELWVANFGNHTATVYKRTAAGDTAPLRVIRSAPLDQPVLGISNPGSVAYDSKREEILVPN
ncbi:MAG: hypothetical protein O7E51_15605 [Acidobacteria bacterium]|nr:hypothetical protein [Acidobacteriota bacterium]